MARSCIVALSIVIVWVASPWATANSVMKFVDETRGPEAQPLSRKTRSVGFPRQGRLHRGVRLRPSRYVQYTDEVARSGSAWGTWELVQLVERAAYRVARRHRGNAQLFVGELSKKEGGRIAGHGSHQNGRDVDLAFYSVNRAGRSHRSLEFVRFGVAGLALSPHKRLRFDDGRNWELVAKLVADGDARVQYIFVSNPVRRRLLRYGQLAHAHPVVLERARRVLTQPSEGHQHDNHFHVRIYCAPGDRPHCGDRGPIHPWYPGTRFASRR